MLLKVLHQPFAYDLCCVVFCLWKISREVFHLIVHVQNHRKKHIFFYANLVFWIITHRQSYYSKKGYPHAIQLLDKVTT